MIMRPGLADLSKKPLTKEQQKIRTELALEHFEQLKSEIDRLYIIEREKIMKNEEERTACSVLKELIYNLILSWER